jgi:hypothetical protein
MYSQVDNLLAAVAEGDYEALGTLAELLDERGDPRAALARRVMELEPQHVARMLAQVRAEKQSDGWARLAMAALAFGLFGIPIPAVGFEPTSDARALAQVEEELQTRQLSADVARAITLSRRAKCDEFLAQFAL